MYIGLRVPDVIRRCYRGVELQRLVRDGVQRRGGLARLHSEARQLRTCETLEVWKVETVGNAAPVALFAPAVFVAALDVVGRLPKESRLPASVIGDMRV